MTTNDKTGDRLVASIRRTKAGAGKPAEPPAETASAAKATPAKTAKAPAKKAAAGSAGARSGNYQSGGRVWPD